MEGRAARPLAVAAVVAGATGYLAAVDPATPGHYPGCPFLALTGWFCPGCGGLRAVHELTRADLPAALSSNAVVTLAVPVAVVLWLLWFRRTLRPTTVVLASQNGGPNPSQTGGPNRRARLAGPVALAIGLILFAVLRNLPGLAVLAP